MSAGRAQGESKNQKRHGRVRRAVKIVGPWRVGVSLVFGVVATILVAWWIALEPGKFPDFPGERRDPVGSHWRGGPVAGGMPPMRFSPGGGDAFEFTSLDDYGTWFFAMSFEADDEHYRMWSSGTHKREDRTRPSWVGGLAMRNRVYSGESLWFKEYAYGWPFLAMKHQHLVPDGKREYFSSVELPLSIRRKIGGARTHAPIGVVPGGFALDAIVWAGPVYVLVSLPLWAIWARRRVVLFRRRRRGLCEACGYRLDGLMGDTCPECGWVIKRAGRGGATAEEGGAGA